MSGDVRLGTGNTIGPNVVIIGPVEIGDDNWIGTGAVIGAPPEVRSWPHPRDAQAPSSGNGVRIGSRNIIREYAQIHQGWKAQTKVGDGAFLMNQVYVAHDCTIADDATLASNVALAGHVGVGAGANLGMKVTVHQYRYIASGAMIGMSAVITRDIPPFAKAYGSPARVFGANRVGMERAGISPEHILALDELYTNAPSGEYRLESMASVAELEDPLNLWFARRPRP